MSRLPSSLPPELEAFITPRRLTRRLPAPMRERVLARVRSPVASGEGPASPPLHQGDLAAGARVRPLVRFAAAASVLLAAGTVWGIVSLHRAPGDAVSPAMPRPQPVSPRDLTPRAAEPVPVVRRAAPPRAAPRPVTRDPFAVELALLQRAQTDYTRRDLSAALAVLAEHAHRFPKGRLAEEREALRVRALLAAGRTAQAHHVATAFAIEFPRSALLQRLENEESPPP